MTKHTLPFSPEVRERAVRLAREHESEVALITTAAAVAAGLCYLVRHAGRFGSTRCGRTIEASERVPREEIQPVRR